MYHDHPYISSALFCLAALACFIASLLLIILVVDPSSMQAVDLKKFFEVMGIVYVCILLPISIFMTWESH